MYSYYLRGYKEAQMGKIPEEKTSNIKSQLAMTLGVKHAIENIELFSASKLEVEIKRMVKGIDDVVALNKEVDKLIQKVMVLKNLVITEEELSAI